MARLRNLLIDLTPPLVARLARRALGRDQSTARSPSSPASGGALTQAERATLVARMDAGDYNFDAGIAARMMADWARDNGAVPYPSALMAAYQSGDAIAMNRIELMELTYQLPYSHAYEASQAGKYQDLVALAAEHGVTCRGAHVADVGCGYGGLLEAVRAAAPDATLHGIECAESALTWMRRNRPTIVTARASLANPTAAFLQACGRTMDVVFCTEVLEHLVHPELGLRNLAALAPSGHVVLTVPNGRADTAAQHINFWSPESWTQFIGATAQGRPYLVLHCPNEKSPGGFENMAIIRP